MLLTLTIGSAGDTAADVLQIPLVFWLLSCGQSITALTDTKTVNSEIYDTDNEFEVQQLSLDLLQLENYYLVS